MKVIINIIVSILIGMYGFSIVVDNNDIMIVKSYFLFGGVIVVWLLNIFSIHKGE